MCLHICDRESHVTACGETFFCFFPSITEHEALCCGDLPAVICGRLHLTTSSPTMRQLVLLCYKRQLFLYQTARVSQPWGMRVCYHTDSELTHKNGDGSCLRRPTHNHWSRDDLAMNNLSRSDEADYATKPGTLLFDVLLPDDSMSREVSLDGRAWQHT